MTFSEALKASLNNQMVVSCTGAIYSPKYLNVKKLSETAFISDAVTTEKERKGNWSLYLLG